MFFMAKNELICKGDGVMDIQLQEFIDKIKKDGVEVAEVEATSIVNNAKAEAEKIIADAKMQAEKILTDAKAENERIVKSGEEAIKQAGRNLLISFRESVAKELKKIVGEKVEALYSGEEFSNLLVTVLENWAKNSDTDDLTLILNSDDLKKFEETALHTLKEKMLGGVTLKASNNFDKGFRIAVDGGSAYYDYSREAVVDMLSDFLSPRVTQLLKEAE
jgi:V/A-type H+-transporting ATPase subunit E